MPKIQTDSFAVVADTNKEILDILLRLNGQDIATFSSYMNVTVSEVEKAPQWAINYLKDIINVELLHIGYVTKDLKALGLFVPYENIEAEVQEYINNTADAGSQPIVIQKDDIITEAGAIKAQYLVYAVDILKEFIKPTEYLKETPKLVLNIQE